jgi:hypothetical protein
VTLRQLDQFGNGLRNEGHGLVRAALFASFWFFGWRFRFLARSPSLPAARSLAQKTCIPMTQSIAKK